MKGPNPTKGKTKMREAKAAADAEEKVEVAHQNRRLWGQDPAWPHQVGWRAQQGWRR